MSSQKEISTLLFWAYRYLKYRLRTKKEMRDYLVKKANTYGFPPTHAEEALHYLCDEKYIDDKVFVEEFISSRTRFKPKGEFALRMELRQKGIAEDLLLLGI